MRIRTALLIASALVLSACSGVPKSTIRYTAPSVNPTRVQVNKAQANVSKAKTSAAVVKEKITQIETAKEATPEMITLAQAANAEVDRLTQSLLDAEKNLEDAHGELTALQTKNDTLTTTLNTTIDEKNAAIKQAAEDRNHAHRLKALLCGAIVAAVGLLVFQFKGLFFMLGPWGWGAMAAIPAAAGGLAWFLL